MSPVFLSGVPSVRGFFVGLGRAGFSVSAGGAAAISQPAGLAGFFGAMGERTSSHISGTPRSSGAHEDYWREHHDQQPYASERPYSDYDVAYRTGYEGFMKYGEKFGSFDAAEAQLREDYEHRLPAPNHERPLGTASAIAAAKAHLLWDEARHAAKTAWKRAHKQLAPRAARLQHAA